ncbi:Putative phosphoserine phosphatase 2 [Paraburkholderia fynbosensis]|uniref:Phosphoserine phosphatase 2 n=2 Tax=Paraburkholderia fynbosensis TaxID=1200993 RepID=A0A6J5FG08_9BURK|nr:Putative phosphoserine phosphatase 2 [Paraburkholderia fynbosensis]
MRATARVIPSSRFCDNSGSAKPANGAHFHLMTTQILFIRHGETDWNRIKRIQGHIDIPLATTGLDQAQRLARRIATEAKQGARLDAIYSSDLQRAQQTAQPIAAALGLPLQLREGLRERSYGAFQGHDSEEIAQRFPDEYAHWQTRDPGFAPPEGESQRVFYHRVVHAIEPLVAAHPGGRIACVAHGGVLDCVRRFASGLPLDAPRDYPLLNTSVNVVNFDNGAAAIVSWADVAHLDAPAEDDGFRKAMPQPGR